MGIKWDVNCTKFIYNRKSRKRRAYWTFGTQNDAAPPRLAGCPPGTELEYSRATHRLYLPGGCSAPASRHAHAFSRHVASLHDVRAVKSYNRSCRYFYQQSIGRYTYIIPTRYEHLSTYFSTHLLLIERPTLFTKCSRQLLGIFYSRWLGGLQCGACT